MSTITVQDTEMQVRTWNGQRVVTFDDIAEVHKCHRDRIRRNFTNNRKHFIMSVDYYEITRKELRENFSPNSKITGNPNISVQLFTESGYLMLVKSLNDDLSWDVQRQLVNGYFKAKEVTEEPKKIVKSSYKTSTALLPKNTNWFMRNNFRMTRICNDRKISRKDLYHFILMCLSEEYDISTANRVYTEETGYPPKYAIDIVSYFPQLAKMADKCLDTLDKKQM